ncbi:GNAT family N-acetyltransferase [Methanomethylovorans sp.]|uniref:GNAT family N-acetyltransferase n=1 Tax=Methanomethylovorans sp. TaxID=2758717 RepID=UPI00351BECDD
MELIPITQDASQMIPDEENCQMVFAMQQEYYLKVGCNRPWIAYFTVEDGQYIGTCAFKGKPAGNRVEIAYFTFPDHEGKGFATRMCRELVEIAQKHDGSVFVCARTLPQISASTRVLENNGFTMTGTVIDPDDGEVWEWKLSDG